MSNEIIAVEPQNYGFRIRYANGGSRDINVGMGASLIHYTQDSITYKHQGKTKVFDLKNNGIRVLN